MINAKSCFYLFEADIELDDQRLAAKYDRQGVSYITQPDQSDLLIISSEGKARPFSRTNNVKKFGKESKTYM